MPGPTLPLTAVGRYSMWPHPSTRLLPVGATSCQRERMPHTIPLSVRPFLVLLIAGALGCGSDLLLPDPPGGSENVALTKLTGDEQIGTVGEPLPSPLIVQVLTESEQPAPGMKVAFVLTADSAAGTVTPDTATTNHQGQAVAHWTLGTTPGPHVVVARLLGDESSEEQIAEFRAAARPAAPDTLSPQIPLAQPGRRQEEVGTPPLVQVVDRYGNPVEGTPVAWQVTAGGGRVEEPISLTDAEGKATVDWTLGNQRGVHKLTAAIGSVTGSPVTFTAIVLF
jgi:hypothetical protein